MKVTHLRAIIGAGLVVAVLGALYLFRERTLNTLVYFIIVLLAALLAGILTNFISGKATYADSIPRRNIYASEGRFVFLFVSCGGIWFYLNTNQTFEFVVYVRGKQGETILRNNEPVQVILNNTPRLERIDHSGRIVITGIPAELKETSVSVELMESADWTFENGKMTDTISLEGQSAQLVITPSKAVCCITGHVYNTQGKVQSGVAVWVEQPKPTISDSVGHFVIELPVAMQTMESIRVFAKRQREEPVSIYASPRNPTSIQVP